MIRSPVQRLIHDAFVQACRLDVAVRKPGNVSLASAGHGMQAAQFVDSAIAAAAQLCTAGRSVGDRIERAVAASFDAVGCNTNLGIVLLSAPLICAAEQPGALRSASALHDALLRVLQGLSEADAAAAYRGIARANPGGLGRVSDEDVNTAPTLDLRSAMALAADRDSIARQYAQGFIDIFERCLPLLLDGTSPSPAIAPPEAPPDAAWAPSPDTVQRVQRIYLTCLVAWPDSHIVRKWDMGVALQVSQQASLWLHHPQPDTDPAFAAWDASMKARGWNPGTSADLTVATLLSGGMLAGAASRASVT